MSAPGKPIGEKQATPRSGLVRGRRNPFCCPNVPFAPRSHGQAQSGLPMPPAIRYLPCPRERHFGVSPMAKLYYTLDEAASKLKKNPDEIKAMVSSGQLQEFRDRDKLMFKVDQVNLLAAGGDEADGSGIIPLAESGELNTISLASDSGTGMNLESPKEQTGISIFDADQTEEADPSAVTQVTESAPTELSLETVGSGSGLLDLTREADDTSLGQDLLEEVSAREGSTANET